jgi:hypothetical protein
MERKMKTAELINLIDLYFDGELEKSREAILFTSLGADMDAREYFKKRNSLQAAMLNEMEEFPQSLDEKILMKLEKIESKRSNTFLSQKVFTAIAYSFSIILLASSIFYYSRSQEYKVQFYDLTREVRKQNEQINLLMNALPQVDVQGSYVKIKEVVVRPHS